MTRECLPGAPGLPAGRMDARASAARRRAAALVSDERLLVGPLKGYHHETYAFPLPAGDGSGRQTWWKCRDPRAGLLWFDLRAFASERELVRALQGSITRIPAVIEREEVSLYTFVEGRTLGEVCPPGQPLSARHSGQLGVLFGELVSVRPESVLASAGWVAGGHPAGWKDDSAAFLAQLIDFTDVHIYQRHLPRYHALFRDLGIPGGALDGLREATRALVPRPSALLHGDLHRENFIVDGRDDLWTIDWELAVVGDPLYDLATHLHLMGYPADQESRITGIWRRAVEGARPGSSEGWEADLPVLRAYKRAQSVYTDVIRTALALGELTAEQRLRQLARPVRRIEGALAAARRTLGLTREPSADSVAAAYARWFKDAAPTLTAPAP
ncbi:phosphotransferase [Streptomyces sp. NPDC096323]|uniref:phosphotransferase n=1 Tax=Streptomyces sp. NPDC096323 TaxID=3155822 RepID=UPI0033201F33